MSRSPKVHRDPPLRFTDEGTLDERPSPPTSPPPWQDWDSYEVEPEALDERVPRHDPPSLAFETPGVVRLALLLAVIVIALLALLAASRSGQTTAPVDVSGTSSAAQSEVSLDPAFVPAAGLADVRPVATSQPRTEAPVPSPSGAISTALIAGNISWADPELGGDYLATRFPRGTLVRICAATCIVRRTNDFGPSAAIDPPRIADLAVLDWEQISGLPRSRGLVRGTIETIEAGPTLPPTDQEAPR